MDLTVRDLAKLLKVPEKTVYRWIEKENLPAYRLHEQYRLNRVELQEWAAAHKVKLPPELYSAPNVDETSLAAAIERGGIHRGVRGTTRDAVLKAVVDLPGIPASVDRKLLYQLLLTREALSSTALGGGIAIPHPRAPLVLQLSEPVVMICFLATPVDFGAIDRQPVHVLLLLLSPSVHTHLRMLSRLSHALHDQELHRAIDIAAPDDTIIRRIHAIEAEIGQRSQAGSRQ